MEQNMDAGWELHPIGGDTGQAYMAVRAQERVFLKRNSSPFLAALSGEGIAPKLMWTKRAGNGDVLTAQEWLNGRSLTTEEMNSMEVIDLLKEIHQSPNLLLMLQKIQGEEYTAQHFIEDYLVNLQSGLQSHRFLSEVLDYLKETLPLVLEAGKTVCHGDLDRRNFLLANDKLYLIDWEMVRLADPVSDLTMILTQYIPVHQWGEWLDAYGLNLSTNIYQRIEWYALMNCLWAKDTLLAHPEMVIQNPEEWKGRWKERFGNDHPIHIEIGSGKGQFVSEMAKKNPEINYIGIEIQTSVIVVALEKALAAEVPNLQLLHIDGGTVTDYFADGEVDRIYLNFSDPWPKKRHAKRRLTHADFLKAYEQVLPLEGEIHFKTDNRGLFEYSLASFSQFGMILKQVWLDLHQVEFEGNVMTEYEEKFSAKGHPIYRVEAIFPKERHPYEVK